VTTNCLAPQVSPPDTSGRHSSRGSRVRWSRRLVAVLAVGVAAASAALAPGALGQGSSLLRPGWAPGGRPSSGTSQVQADQKYAASYCAANAVLLFRVRGTGESYGTDPLGKWTAAAGDALIARGWNVRDMQAVYDAPPLPIIGSARQLVGALSRGLGGVAAQVVAYRNVASREWRQVASQLTQAEARCREREIIVAGYSYGALILRYVIPSLSPSVLRQIVHVDLVADPTAQASVDNELAKGGPSPRRTTGSGLDTWSGDILHHAAFHQTRYPSSIASHTYQYCFAYDVVCDTNAVNLNPVALVREFPRHEHYPWRTIGTFAASALLARGS